jgi:hypothetical protein
MTCGEAQCTLARSVSAEELAPIGDGLSLRFVSNLTSVETLTK